MSDHDTWNRRPHPDDLKAACADASRRLLATVKVIQVAAAPVLAGKEVK